jgi:hypothetical protein
LTALFIIIFYRLIMKSSSVGNAFHIIVSASVLAYTTSTFLYANPGSKFFDDDWIQHGFCVIQKDIPYFNSHDLCLYFDVLFVSVGLIIYWSLKGMPVNAMKTADEMMLFNLLGHLGHGFAHGFIATNYRSEDGLRDVTSQSSVVGRYMNGEEDIVELVKALCLGLVFWFGLLKGACPKLPLSKIGMLAMFIVYGSLFVRNVLGFAYVQAVITVAFSGTQLMLPEDEKNFVFAANSVAGFVISLIPWVESTLCHRVLAKFGGHLVYDISIPIALIVAYCVSWRHYSSLQKKEKDA